VSVNVSNTGPRKVSYFFARVISSRLFFFIIPRAPHARPPALHGCCVRDARQTDDFRRLAYRSFIYARIVIKRGRAEKLTNGDFRAKNARLPLDVINKNENPSRAYSFPVWKPETTTFHCCPAHNTIVTVRRNIFGSIRPPRQNDTAKCRENA